MRSVIIWVNGQADSLAQRQCIFTAQYVLGFYKSITKSRIGMSAISAVKYPALLDPHCTLQSKCNQNVSHRGH